MKSLSILASLAGLASAVSFANPFIRSGSLEPRVLNGSVLANSSDFANIINNNNNNNGLNLLNPNLNIDGLDLSNLDLTNQNDVAQAIQLMLAGLCLGNVLDLNSILGLGLNNDLELFQELVQLIQLEQLGFLSNGGVRSLFNSGFLLGNFNLGLFKREVATAKKTMKRTRLRRSVTTKTKRQCASFNAAPAAAASSIDLAGLASAAAAAAPEASAAAAVTQAADAAPEASAAAAADEGVFSVATVPLAAATQAAAVAAPAAAVVNNAPAAAAAPVVPVATAAAAAAAGAADLSDFTR